VREMDVSLQKSVDPWDPKCQGIYVKDFMRHRVSGLLLKIPIELHDDDSVRTIRRWLKLARRVAIPTLVCADAQAPCWRDIDDLLLSASIVSRVKRRGVQFAGWNIDPQDCSALELGLYSSRSSLADRMIFPIVEPFLASAAGRL